MAKKRTPPRNKDGTFRKRKKRRATKKRRASGRRAARCLARNRKGRFTRWVSGRPGCRRRRARKGAHRRRGVSSRRAAGRKAARMMRRHADGTFIGKKHGGRKSGRKSGRRKKRARMFGPATPAWLRNRVKGLGGVRSAEIHEVWHVRDMLQNDLPGLSKAKATKLAKAAVRDAG